MQATLEVREWFLEICFRFHSYPKKDWKFLPRVEGLPSGRAVARR